MTIGTRSGRWLGCLLLLHLALGLIGPYVVLVPVLAPPGGFMENAAQVSGPIRASAMALMIAAIIPIAISFMLADTAWNKVKVMTAWLIASAVAHLALQLVENVSWLTMLSASEAHQASLGNGGLDHETMKLLISSTFKWIHYSHILVLVSWILLLFLTLGKARLLPRWLAGIGVVAAGLHFAGITLPEFIGYRVNSASLWGIPLAVVYLATAIWLIALGFPNNAVSGSARGST